MKLDSQWTAFCKMRSEGYKLFSKGDKLRNEGYKLYSEADKLWDEAIAAAYSNAQIIWDGLDCTVNGDHYMFEEEA